LPQQFTKYPSVNSTLAFNVPDQQQQQQQQQQQLQHQQQQQQQQQHLYNENSKSSKLASQIENQTRIKHEFQQHRRASLFDTNYDHHLNNLELLNLLQNTNETDQILSQQQQQQHQQSISPNLIINQALGSIHQQSTKKAAIKPKDLETLDEKLKLVFNDNKANPVNQQSAQSNNNNNYSENNIINDSQLQNQMVIFVLIINNNVILSLLDLIILDSPSISDFKYHLI
jgi:hypothetical protein